ncbi:MAG TPA: hypothetical protein VEW04_03480, partial [Allosphingosinicella sp.]|nr:hypothetical protein [Allosphingosinicella sp.]
LDGAHYSARNTKEWVGLFLTEEWLWAAVICAVPFFAFGAWEAVSARKRRRMEALARRSKCRQGGW